MNPLGVVQRSINNSRLCIQWLYCTPALTYFVSKYIHKFVYFMDINVVKMQSFFMVIMCFLAHCALRCWPCGVAQLVKICWLVPVCESGIASAVNIMNNL